MEDNLNFFEKGRRPNFFENRRRPQKKMQPKTINLVNLVIIDSYLAK